MNMIRLLKFALLALFVTACATAPAPSPKAVCWDGSPVDSINACPSQPPSSPMATCWDGSMVYDIRSCPTKPGVGSSPPLFDWPENSSMTLFTPPQTDLKMDIPNIVFKNRLASGELSDPTLLQVYDKLIAVLTHDPKLTYPNRVFRYKNGFVILTKPERINEKAKIITYEAGGLKGYKIDLDENLTGGIINYLLAIVTKPKKRFRYLAFIVTARAIPVTDSGHPASVVVLDDIFTTGGLPSDLPPYMKNHFFTKDYKCQVWIYEFSKIDKHNADQINQAVSVTAKPLLSEERHIEGAPPLSALFSLLPR